MSATGSSWSGRTDDPVAAPAGGVGPSVPSSRPAPSGRVAAVGVSGDGRHWCQLVDGCQQSLAPWPAPSWVVASREPSMAPACYPRADRGSAGGSARQAHTFRVSLVEPGDGAGVAPLGALRGPRPSGSRRSRGNRRCGHHRRHLTQGPSGRRRGHVRGAAAATRRYPAARPPCGGRWPPGSHQRIGATCDGSGFPLHRLLHIERSSEARRRQGQSSSGAARVERQAGVHRLTLYQVRWEDRWACSGAVSRWRCGPGCSLVATRARPHQGEYRIPSTRVCVGW